MADNTHIEWADATLNFINGCSVITPGCINCYAMRLAGTRMKYHPTRAGLTSMSKTGPVWNGSVLAHQPHLLQALAWRRPRRIFWNAHGDMFHESVPVDWIDAQFAVMAVARQHQHLILTKRSKRMRAYANDPETPRRIAALVLRNAAAWNLKGEALLALLAPRAREDDPEAIVWPLPNVWWGVSVEDQTRADIRVGDLLATPAALRFLSMEPLLGPVDLGEVCGGNYFQNPLTGHRWHDAPEGIRSASDMAGNRIDWVIVGGESGPGARPMHPAWVRSLRDQCAAAGVPFFFKQWGEWAPEWFDTDSGVHPDSCYMDDGSPRWPGKAFHVDGNFRSVAGQGTAFIRKCGKKAAGRLLDGVEHNGFPELPHAR